MNIIDKKTLLNIIYNDLGITKDDLRAIIINEFKGEARRVCSRQIQKKINPCVYPKDLIDKEVKNILNEWNFRDRIIESISRTLRNTLEISIKKN